MQIFIETSSLFKFAEFQKYFHDIGLSVTRLEQPFDIPIEGCLVIREQTTLVDTKGQICNRDIAQACIHKSIIWATHISCDPKTTTTKEYKASVQGFIFPFLRQNNDNVYGWDDIFVSKNTHLTNQALKERGIKTSARDLAFALLVQDLKEVFYLKEQANLRFNPLEDTGVISFEPFVQTLCQDEPLYQVAYHNNFFKPLLNQVLNEGLFIRRAKTRQQKNYWLPGVNAGIPLTPKKDNIHELTFMFHDLMHFLFPDLVITHNDEKNKKVYILARMMSEAFTLVLADAMYVHLLAKQEMEYDFTKRRIYPLFKNGINQVDINSIDSIIKLLYANANFALLGKDKMLHDLNPEAFLHYKEKYQKFFNKDYIWTQQNYEYLVKQVRINEQWLSECKKYGLLNIQSTQEFAKDLSSTQTLDVFEYVFQHFISRLKEGLNATHYDPVLAFKNGYKKFMAGQMMIFYKQEAHYNALFKENILSLLKQLNTTQSIDKAKLITGEITQCYELYLDTLLQDKLISSYRAEQYKSIYPLFDPFFVFYERQGEPDFYQTLYTIFKDLT